jgi:hypothetical protein
MNVESQITFPASNSFENNITPSSPITTTNNASPTTQQQPATNLFGNFSPQFETQHENGGFPLEDPFQVFDPFNNNDPFKSAPMNNTNNIKAGLAMPSDDPFANAFDPFNQQQQDSPITSGFGSDDPFSVSCLTEKKFKEKLP